MSAKKLGLNKVSQKICIPDIHQVLILSEDWTFRLYFEERNLTMLICFGLHKNFSFYRYITKALNSTSVFEPNDFIDEKIPEFIEYEEPLPSEELKNAYSSYKSTHKHKKPYINVTLPKGTQLKVERVYIRQGAESFSSLTFRVGKKCPDERFSAKRFWASLKDVNKINADII